MKEKYDYDYEFWYNEILNQIQLCEEWLNDLKEESSIKYRRKKARFEQRKIMNTQLKELKQKLDEVSNIINITLNMEGDNNYEQN